MYRSVSLCFLSDLSSRHIILKHSTSKIVIENETLKLEGYQYPGLAPENPFPAAIEDAVSTLQWVSFDGPATISIDPSRIAVGGASSGGNISAVLALKASTLSLRYPLKFQLLIPAINLTLIITNSTCCAEKQHTTGASAASVDFYVKTYLPDATEEDKRNWKVSPIFAPPDLVKKSTQSLDWC